MTKESIIERLLEQGHIVMVCADRILNKRGGYIQDIEDLHRDGPISTSEAVVLLREDNPLLREGTTPVFPNTTQYPFDYPTPPPIYCQTSTFDSPLEYSDTKWPKETKR